MSVLVRKRLRRVSDSRHRNAVRTIQRRLRSTGKKDEQVLRVSKIPPPMPLSLWNKIKSPTEARRSSEEWWNLRKALATLDPLTDFHIKPGYGSLSKATSLFKIGGRVKYVSPMVHYDFLKSSRKHYDRTFNLTITKKSAPAGAHVWRGSHFTYVDDDEDAEGDPSMNHKHLRKQLRRLILEHNAFSQGVGKMGDDMDPDDDTAKETPEKEIVKSVMMDRYSSRRAEEIHYVVENLLRQGIPGPRKRRRSKKGLDRELRAEELHAEMALKIDIIAVRFIKQKRLVEIEWSLADQNLISKENEIHQMYKQMYKIQGKSAMHPGMRELELGKKITEGKLEPKEISSGMDAEAMEFASDLYEELMHDMGLNLKPDELEDMLKGGKNIPLSKLLPKDGGTSNPREQRMIRELLSPNPVLEKTLNMFGNDINEDKNDKRKTSTTTKLARMNEIINEAVRELQKNYNAHEDKFQSEFEHVKGRFRLEIGRKLSSRFVPDIVFICAKHTVSKTAAEDITYPEIARAQQTREALNFK